MKFEHPSVEIHAELQNVCGKDALKLGTFCKFVQRFKDGRESIENYPTAGRPKSVVTEKMLPS